MKTPYKSRLLALILGCGIVLAPLRTLADDIDIFVGSSGGTATNANVLIVLDNTSNWSMQAQHWPGGITQGQSEVNAIKNVIGTLNGSINVGLMEFTTGSGGGNDGGFIRQAVKPMNATNISTFQTKLTTIYNNINSTDEKQNSSMPYGILMFDAFKYFGGYTSPAHATDNVAGTPTDATHFGQTAYAASGKVPASLADAAGYSSAYTTFASPISEDDNCARNYIIFIGNGFPNADNTTLLSNVGGDTSKIALADYTTTTTPGACVDKGYQASCVSNANQCVTTDYTVTTAGDFLQCDTTRYSTAGCTGGKKKYMVQECATPTITATPTGTYSFASPTSNERYADEWARFLYQTDVSSATGQQNVSTFTIDVYKDQQSADQTALLRSMAKMGGGKYFAATNEAAITNALKEIFAEIQSVNSTFASASLPVNATNRAQNENQVFIGMFRPDPDAKPLWPGNMKRYQLINSGGSVELGDSAGNLAVNSQTGFISDCATSYWTTDSGTYWATVPENPSPAGRCPTTAYDKYSDAPDGPIVEKGAVAEVIRKGNNPPTTNTTPTWAVNRTIYTLSGSALTPFNTTSSGLDAATVNFTLGQDVNNENGNASLTETRPSLHGDVIHSRPLPINYGSGITVYYGANDGTFRAVEAATGKERWAFIAPEFFSRLQRLKDNAPLINYPNVDASLSPQKKDYFFDGSIGVYQNADNSEVWIYPTMRRGGRMIYGFDVTTPTSPTFKWKAGCPNLTNDTGCTTGLTGIGQTWSMPNVAFIKGYSTTTPVLVVGGGYDSCEDANTSSPTCASPKGAGVHILDASTGAVIASFSTTRSVVADVALIDVDNDGNVDYAYATDTGGNIYRINFINATTKAALSSNSWAINRVAYTNGAGRKFLYPPALLAAPGEKVYLAIGSGDREHPLQTQYPYTGVTNRFYVFLDDLATTTTYNLDDTASMNNYTSISTCTTAGVLPTSTMKGWFMDLNQYGQGEQTVSSAVIASGMATFNTNRPIPAATGSCGTVLGEARGYWVNLFNASGTIGVTGNCGGNRSTAFIGGGLPPSPVTGTVLIGGVPTSVIIGAPPRSGGVASPYNPGKLTPAISSKRKMKYWKSSGDN